MERIHRGSSCRTESLWPCRRFRCDRFSHICHTEWSSALGFDVGHDPRVGRTDDSGPSNDSDFDRTSTLDAFDSAYTSDLDAAYYVALFPVAYLGCIGWAVLENCLYPDCSFADPGYVHLGLVLGPVLVSPWLSGRYP
ncbi:hypothetical protein PSPO01_08139 [Paraphaeosphaeria sporulosa]